MGNKLTYYDRQQIALWRRVGLDAKQITERIGRDRSVVWREVGRNSGYYLSYDANKAHYFAQRRAGRTNRPILEKDAVLHDYVVGKLEENWSPEQIAGRLKKYPVKGLVGKKIPYEAIYQFIYDKEPWLYHKPRRAHPDRQPKCQRKKRKVFTPDRVPICLRPDKVNNRSELGHFESDSMVGKGHNINIAYPFNTKGQFS